MVRPVQPYPVKQLDGTWIWIDPTTEQKINMKKYYSEDQEDIRARTDLLTLVLSAILVFTPLGWWGVLLAFIIGTILNILLIEN